MTGTDMYSGLTPQKGHLYQACKEYNVRENRRRTLCLDNKQRITLCLVKLLDLET